MSIGKPDRSKAVRFDLARSEGDRAAFTRDEVRSAFVVIGVPADFVDRAVEEIFDMDSAGGIVFDEVLLSAIGSLSEDCQRRVVDWLQESPSETEARLARFQAELQRRFGEIQ